MKKIKPHILSIIVIAIMAFLALASDAIELEAQLESNDTQLIITNNDSFHWKGVTMRLNDKYILKARIIKSGRTITIDMNRFICESDRKLKFDPATMTPEKLHIWVEHGEADYVNFYFSTEEKMWKKGYKPNKEEEKTQDIPEDSQDALE